MKPLVWLAAAALTTACTLAPAWAHDQGHTPLHGGTVAEVADVDYELVATAQAITLHLRDHGQSVATEGASAQLTVLVGRDKREVQLTPASDGRLQAQGDFALPAGTKVLAQVSLAGKKPVQLRFALK